MFLPIKTRSNPQALHAPSNLAQPVGKVVYELPDLLRMIGVSYPIGTPEYEYLEQRERKHIVDFGADVAWRLP